MSATDRCDLYDRVRSQIVAQLQQGILPWRQPWDTDLAAGPVSRPLRHNGERYQGINVLLLWGTALECGYASPFWLTYRQAETLGGFVRKGEHGCRVVYTACRTTTVIADDGSEVERDAYFRKQYFVFNADQCRGLPWEFLKKPVPPKPIARIERAERFFAATRADVRYGGTRAYYSPAGDYIGMPPRDAFRDSESHVATLAHEFVHWTGHATRLARDFFAKGSDAYAREELVAELGAAFLCADLGLEPEPLPDHASYIDSWIAALNGDKRTIFTAATQATRAAEYLHGLQPALPL